MMKISQTSGFFQFVVRPWAL